MRVDCLSSECDTRADLLGLPADEQVEIVIEYLKAALASMSGRDAKRIDTDAEWPAAHRLLVLLQPTILRELRLPLYDCDVPFCRSVRRLAEHVVSELKPPPAPTGAFAELYEPNRWAWDFPQHCQVRSSSAGTVFVLSAPRSGSTLLRVMLAGHSGVFAPPELHLLPFQTMKRRHEQMKTLGYTWMKRGLVSALISGKGGSVRAQHAVSTMEEQDCPIATVYGRLSKHAAGLMLVDKTPTYSYHPRWNTAAEDLFPGARYIHLVRRPRAAIESFVRMRFHRLFGPHWLVWDANGWCYAEKCWTACNMHIQWFLERIAAQRHLLVRYEDLVTSPTFELLRICRFLRLEFQSAMLTPYAGNRLLNDHATRTVTLGDPNFLNHNSIEPLAAHQGLNAAHTFPLSDITRVVADRLQYPDE